MNRNLKIVVAIFVLAVIIFVIKNKYFSKTETFKVLRNFEYSDSVVDNDYIKTIQMNSIHPLQVSSGFVYLTKNKLTVKSAAPLPDGGDYKTNSNVYKVFGDSEYLGDLKRKQDGWLYLEIKRPIKDYKRYVIKINDTEILSN